LSFCEDNDVPRALVDETGTSSTEATAYSSTPGSNGHNETQYVNWLQPCRNLSDSYDASKVKACNFGLPTQTGTGTGYYIRLYVSPNTSTDDTAMPSGAFYTIRRAYTFSTPTDALNPLGEYTTFKTFSDYYAVVIPDGVDALYVGNANKADHTVTLMPYPLETIGGKRVLPAGAAVILATKETGNPGTSGQIVKSEKMFDYHSEPEHSESSYTSRPNDNLLKSQIERTKLPWTSDNGTTNNYLFAFKKRHDTDLKKTIGFFQAGAANNPVNTAYLQLNAGFLDANAQGTKGWTMVLDFSEPTDLDLQRKDDACDSGNGCYTLQGVKVGRPVRKGIYIINGKKTVIK
ncbi:MAG: hypothetical protein MSA31_02310, partial [Bacteroidales bacterium]|nr:hypothetical protein [Bacteroidales bacterium]